MSVVLNSVWLIDDDSDEHFLLKRAFSRSGICPEARSFVQPQEAVDAFVAGAQHLTIPFDVLMGLSTHPVSEQTIEQFNAEGIGLRLKS